MTFVAAIIGRPNVGKSTLFNRLTGKRLALVDNTPGLTRDRREGTANLGPLSFKIIDTAGLERPENDSIEELMMIQTEVALEEADVILMMIDAKEGLTAEDEFFGNWVRKKNKPTFLLANKSEGKIAEANFAEAYKLGIGEPIAVSAEHGQGLGDLYEAIEESLKDKIPSEEELLDDDESPEKSEQLSISIVGRPNAGKSTLFNNLIGSERSITSPIAGTTRDSVLVDLELEGRNIKLVDTAGLRKKAKLRESSEKLAVTDSLKSIQYANVVVLLLDATQGLEKQDLTIADHVVEEGRALIIAINKWDLIKDKEALLEEINYKLEKSLAQAKGVEVITLSAIKGKNVKSLMKRVFEVFDIWNLRISTGKLNRWLKKVTEEHTPPLSKGKRIKFRYVTQIKGRPPTFVLFSSSNTRDLPGSYFKYLSNSLREEFGFLGVPIRVLLRKVDNPYDKSKKKK